MLWWLLIGSLGASAREVSWESVVDTATLAWSHAEGATYAARVEGAERASRVAVVAPSFSASARLGVPTNQEAVATVQAPLGLGLRPKQRWTATAEALEAAGAADRLAFLERVVVAWSAWSTTHELAEHLQEWSAEVQGTLAPYDAAVAQGVAAPLDAEDLRAELATVRAEAAATRAEAVHAEATLRTLLGPEVVLNPDGLHLHDLDLTHLPNPWAPLVDWADRAPEVRALTAEAAAWQAEARDLRTWRPTVEAGVAFADGTGTFAPLAVVGVQAPLRVGGAAEAREASASALAAERHASWRTERIAGGWRAEAAGYDADLEQIVRLDAEVVAPLAQRLDRLQAAFADGLVAADRVIRARRDHHEAEHERLVLTAHLLASGARAEAVRRQLETP